MTLPLMCMAAEFDRRQMELQNMLYAKDKEIEDLKSQGVTVSRSIGNLNIIFIRNLFSFDFLNYNCYVLL